jgi:hypothetical protein
MGEGIGFQMEGAGLDRRINGIRDARARSRWEKRWVGWVGVKEWGCTRDRELYSY